MPLHIECADFLHMETLSNNPLFKNCSSSFLREVAVRLKPEIATPGEYIINKGDSAKAMYFIDRGDVDIMRDSESEVVLGTQTSGEFFGDVAILACCKRTASVRARTFCDLHVLLADDLHGLLELYESDARVVAKNVLQFLLSKESNDKKSASFSRAFRVLYPLCRQDSGARLWLALYSTKLSQLPN